MLRRARPMTSPRMAEIGDVAQRLADGMPAVLTVQQYVAACAHVGYHHPDLTVHAAQLRDWYGSEDGMDLEALLNDCLVLEAAASAAGALSALVALAIALGIALVVQYRLHRAPLYGITVIWALIAIIVANSSPLNIAVSGLALIGILAILALRGTDTE